MSAEHGQLQQPGGRRGRSPGDKKSRRRSRRKETYSMYIYKVLKQVSVGGPPWAWGGGWRKPGKGLDGVQAGAPFTPSTDPPRPSCGVAFHLRGPGARSVSILHLWAEGGSDMLPPWSRGYTGLWGRQNSHVGP